MGTVIGCCELEELMKENYVVDHVVDACGLSCPMPLLKAKQRLNKMNEGECLQLLATDKGSIKDIPAFVALTNHTLIDPDLISATDASEKRCSDQLESESVYVYYIVKGL